MAKPQNSRKKPIGKYAEFFESHQRLKSKKKIAVVRGDRFAELIRAVVADPEIDDPEYKAFFCVCLSGGLRVSEGLSLRKADFFEQEGGLYASVKVLKKKRQDQRYIRVHPDAVECVKSIIDSKVTEIFQWVSVTCIRKVRGYLKVPDLCNHSLRHSAISYYLFEEKLSREETSKLVHVSSKIIDFYAHLDEKKVLRGLFKPK